MEKLILLATTDVHGSVYAHSYADGSTLGLGLSRFSSAVKEYRSKGETLVLDNGDILQGTPLLTVANKTPHKHVLSQILNHIDYDAVNLGNHDFNFGHEVYRRYLRDLNAPCLTSNILDHETPIGRSKLFRTAGDRFVALIGVCTDYVPHWEKPAHIRNLNFLDPIETVKKEIVRLRPYADAVVVMYHGGLERDPSSGTPTERPTGENVGYALACLDGIDILITGHQHRSFVAKINQTLVTQSTFNAKEFVEITIDFDQEEKCVARIIPMDTFERDEAIEEIARPIEIETQKWLDQPLGSVDGPSLKVDDSFLARLHKHPLVSFINQVQMEVSHAQLSAVALFNNTSGFNPDITMRDIVSTYIYPNTLVVKQIDGKTLKEFLEKCAEYFSLRDDRIIVNPQYDEPKPQHFNYDMVDGVDYTINVSNPIGSRIQDLRYKGKPVTEKDSFTIVMNNYRAVGGGDFMMIPSLPTVGEINRDMAEILAETIQKHKRYRVVHHDNITVIR